MKFKIYIQLGFLHHFSQIQVVVPLIHASGVLCHSVTLITASRWELRRSEAADPGRDARPGPPALPDLVCPLQLRTLQAAKPGKSSNDAWLLVHNSKQKTRYVSRR